MSAQSLRVTGALIGGSPRNGMGLTRPYVYRGSQPLIAEETTTQRQPPAPRNKPTRAACGTYAGYQAHRRLKERICDPCKTAKAADSRARRANGARW